jgi:hypothetical protein
MCITCKYRQGVHTNCPGRHECNLHTSGQSCSGRVRGGEQQQLLFYSLCSKYTVGLLVTDGFKSGRATVTCSKLENIKAACLYPNIEDALRASKPGMPLPTNALPSLLGERKKFIGKTRNAVRAIVTLSGVAVCDNAARKMLHDGLVNVLDIYILQLTKSAELPTGAKERVFCGNTYKTLAQTIRDDLKHLRPDDKSTILHPTDIAELLSEWVKVVNEITDLNAMAGVVQDYSDYDFLLTVRERGTATLISHIERMNSEAARRFAERLTPTELPQLAGMLERKVAKDIAAEASSMPSYHVPSEHEKEFAYRVQVQATVESMSTLATFVARVKEFHNYLKKAFHRTKDCAAASFARMKSFMQTVPRCPNLSTATYAYTPPPPTIPRTKLVAALAKALGETSMRCCQGGGAGLLTTQQLAHVAKGLEQDIYQPVLDKQVVFEEGLKEYVGQGEWHVGFLKRFNVYAEVTKYYLASFKVGVRFERPQGIRDFGR